MKLKKLVAALLAATMTILMAAPAMAAVTRTTSNGLFYTDNRDPYINPNSADKELMSNYPCWIWAADGCCYYYQNSAAILKNATTPDGHTVDKEGRWTLNGVVQSNGYGNLTMGTDVYNGKSNDEIWILMLNKLEDAFSKGIPLNSDGLTYGYWMTKNQGIAYDLAGAGESGNNITIYHNADRMGTYITARIGGSWSDLAEGVVSSISKAAYYNNPFIKEKTIKAVVGDQIGQELFAYIRQHADKMDMSGGYKTIVDENGNTVKGWIISSIDDSPNQFTEDPNGPDWKREWSAEPVGDGIRAETLDLSMWQNRTTDYGKTFNVKNNEGLIVINVY